MDRPFTLDLAQARIVTGVVAAIGSITYLFTAWSLPMGSLSDPGAGLFPVFVGFVALVSSVIVVVDGMSMKGAGETFDLPWGPKLVRISWLFASLAFYGVALPYLGHLVSSFVAAAAIMKVLSGRSLARSLAYAAIMSAAVYFVFSYLLGVPLPRGVIGY